MAIADHGILLPYAHDKLWWYHCSDRRDDNDEYGGFGINDGGDGGGGSNTCICILKSSLNILSVAFVDQAFAMVTAVKGTLVDGVFTTTNEYKGYASTSAVPIKWLPRDAVVAITLAGKSRGFSIAIASTNTLNYYVYRYDNNHHAAFHYSSLFGRVNSDVPYDGSNGTFARHRVDGGGPFTAVLTLRGFDRTVSFSVNKVQQSGVWALPTTDAFYLILATSGGGTIAVTDATVTGMADLA